jgi:hypothetical protein
MSNALAIGEVEHGNERSRQPCNTVYRDNRVRSCEQLHCNLGQDVEGEGKERRPDEAKCQPLSA